MKIKTDNCILVSPKPLLIAGPCSAESRDQVLNTARALAGIPGLVAFRAGIWKPRTRPGDFEGVGKEGLSWMQEVKEELDLKLAVEVAIPAHVDDAIKAGIDIVWIGARTVVSPFVIDELARALSGVDICVMVKNPINPDLSLWVGGIERLMKVGIENLAAVHRGFDAYSSKPYRNLPLWEIPMELKRLFPSLPLLCDPSHIGGKRALLQSISQKAMDLGMDGLMIESHIDPDKALTDTSQQIIPKKLQQLIEQIEIKEHKAKADPHLEKYRLSLDEIDEQLIELLSKRMQIAEMIGKYKKEFMLAPYQPERWAKLLDDRIQQGVSLNLHPDFIKKIFDLIHLESIRKQS